MAAAAPRSGSPSGIHWHMNVANKVEYIALDDKKQDIPYWSFTAANGTVRSYKASVTNDALTAGTRRIMDCTDCHSRPATRLRHRPNAPSKVLLAQPDAPHDAVVRREMVAHYKNRATTVATAAATPPPRPSRGTPDRLTTTVVAVTQELYPPTCSPR